MKQTSAAGLALGAFTVSALAAAMVASHPAAALLLWVLGGLALAASVAAGPVEPPALGRAPGEIPAFLAFFAIAAWARLHAPGLAPPGVSFPEMAAIDKARSVADAYTAHAVDFHVGWPTLVFYQGLLAQRLLGWGLVSYRLVSGLWGWLGLVALVMGLRAWRGPWVALTVGLLACYSNLDVAISRMFYSSSVLLFAFGGGLYFAVKALTSGRRWQWWASGLCAGLFLHGYFPGRVAAAFFALWVFLACRRDPAGRWRAWAAWMLGFLIMASPVLIWALMHWNEYWAHVQDMASGGFHSVADAWNYYKGLVLQYMGCFHLRGDGRPTTDDGLPLIALLAADPLSRALFPLGFFAALFTLLRPLPLFIVGGVVSALVPGILGTGFPQPTTRRIVLVLPAVYMAVAYALGLGADAWRRWQGRPLPAWLRGAFLLAAAGVAVASYQSYFRVMADTRVRIQWDYGCVLARQAFDEHPQAVPIIGHELYHPPECALLMKDPAAVKEAFDFEDYLRDTLGHASIVALDPYLAGWDGALQRWFPHAQIQPLTHDPEELFDNRQDPNNKDTWFVRCFIPLADRMHFVGLARAGGEGPWRPEPGPAHLAGIVLSGERNGTVSFKAPGWSVRVNGRPVAQGRPVAVGGQSAFVELSGDSTGGPPRLSAINAQGAQLYPDSFLPLGTAHGWSVKVEDAQPGSILPPPGWDLFPPQRVYVTDPLRLPAWRVETAELRASVPGPLWFTVDNPFMQWQLLADGKLVAAFDGATVMKPQAVALRAGHPVKLTVRFKLDYAFFRCMTVDVRYRTAPTGPDEPLPLAWLTPMEER